MNLTLIVFTAVGGGIGAVLRYIISYYVNKTLGPSFAYGTLSVNVIGSFFIGFLFLYFEHIIAPNLKTLLITGMLGALTTFSTFSLETIIMFQNGLVMKAFTNIFANVLFSLLATILGMVFFKKFFL